jgi:hypothetical protein
MNKLKTWWATLTWWQKGLAALPVGLVALALLAGALWPRKQVPLPVLPVAEILPSVAAVDVQAQLDGVVEQLHKNEQAAEEAATDAKAKIDRASSLAGVDAVLYSKGE